MSAYRPQLAGESYGSLVHSVDSRSALRVDIDMVATCLPASPHCTTYPPSQHEGQT